MAELQGGTPNPAPRRAGVGRAQSGGQGGFDPNLLALNLQARQTADRRPTDDIASDAEFQGIMGGDTMLTDDSLGGAGRRSVLEAGAQQRSYTEGQQSEVEAPMAGGGLMESPAMELLRARQRETQMLRTQEQFVGAPTQAAEAPGAAAPSAPTEAMAEEAPEAEEAEETADELRQAQSLQREQQRSALSNAKERVKEELKNRLKQQLEKRLAKRATSGAIRGTLEGTEVATSETVVPLIILILELNIQMINKYIFTPMLFKGWNEMSDEAIDGAPFFDQSFVEDIITVWIDIMLTCGQICFNPFCMPFTCLIIIIGGVGGTVAGLVKASGS